MKFCPQCGRQTTDDALFCAGCGTPFKISVPQAVEPNPAASEQQATPARNEEPTQSVWTTEPQQPEVPAWHDEPTQSVWASQTEQQTAQPRQAVQQAQTVQPQITNPYLNGFSGATGAPATASGTGAPSKPARNAAGTGNSANGKKKTVIIIVGVVVIVLLICAVLLFLFHDRITEATGISLPWQKKSSGTHLVVTEKASEASEEKTEENVTEDASETEEASAEEETAAEETAAKETTAKATEEETTTEAETESPEEQLAGTWQGILNTVISLDEDGTGDYCEPMSSDESLKNGVSITWTLDDSNRLTIHGLSYEIYADWSEGENWFIMDADVDGWNPELFQKKENRSYEEAKNREMVTLEEVTGITDYDYLLHDIIGTAVYDVLESDTLTVFNKDGSTQQLGAPQKTEIQIWYNSEGYVVRESDETYECVFPVRIDLTIDGTVKSISALIYAEQLTVDGSEDYWCSDLYDNINYCVEEELASDGKTCEIEKMDLPFGKWLQ